MKLSEIASVLHSDLSNKYFDIDIQSVEIDTRTLQPGALFVALQGERFDGHDFIHEAEQKGALCILASQSVSTHLPVIKVKDTLEALTRLALQHRLKFLIPIVGLTGSCGKTTIKFFIDNIFKQSASTLSTRGTLNNHIGVPLTLLRLRPEHQYAVIEMGANHPGEILHLTQMVQPTTALITNIAPVHLEGFKSLEGIAKSKAEIFQGLYQGTAIINADEPYSKEWKALNKHQTILTFGRQNPADIMGKDLMITSESKVGFTLLTPKGNIFIQLQLTGEHQMMNALAAAAAAYAHNIPLTQIKKGLESLEAVDHRMSHVKSPEGAHIIDDSYNANPASTLAALHVLKKVSARKKIFIFADMLELGEQARYYHENMGEAAKEMGIDMLFGYGELAQFSVHAFGEQAFHFENKTQLTAALKKEIDPQTTLLVKGSNHMKMWEIVEAITHPNLHKVS